MVWAELVRKRSCVLSNVMYEDCWRIPPKSQDPFSTCREAPLRAFCSGVRHSKSQTSPQSIAHSTPTASAPVRGPSRNP